MNEDLILVHHAGSVFKCGGDFFARQLGIAFQNPVHRIAARNHPEDIANHDPGAANDGLAATDGRVDFDVVHR